MKYNLNYIETTMNGYIIKRCPILENVSRKEISKLNPYDEEMYFNIETGKNVDVMDAKFDDLLEDGVIIEYAGRFAGDFDTLERFLEFGTPNTDGKFAIKKNLYLEFWLTENLGWFDNKYIGLEIKPIK